MMRFHPTVEIPPWPPSDDPTATNPSSPYCLQEALTALQRYLPSNSPDNPDSPIDAYSCDSFRMYEFKVRRCMRGRSHDWTECPYAHPGEKARRRDPRKYNYSGTACQDFRKGCCKKGDACEFAHGVFECWLHPARYRTQACKDGQNCRRRVCFFAHSADQLRVLSDSPVSSPPMSSSFESSPPESPMELSRSLGSLQLGGGSGKWKSLANSWGTGMGIGMHVAGSISRGGFCSLPSTPTRCVSNRNGGFDGVWDGEEEPVMERVESGRDLRMKMFERISKGSCLDPVDPDPDVGWVSDLLK